MSTKFDNKKKNNQEFILIENNILQYFKKAVFFAYALKHKGPGQLGYRAD